MTAQLAPVPVQKFFDANGFPLYLGTLTTYAAGTTTPQATYVDSTQTTPNTNPINLNFRGECNLWLDPTLSYKMVLKDIFGNIIWTVDNIPGGFGILPIANSLIPTPTNTRTLGNSSFSWANLYLGPNAAPVLDTVTGNIGYYARTATEISAAVTPTNYSYNPLQGLDVRRYGAACDGVTDDTAAIQRAISVCAASTNWGSLIIPGKCLVSSSLFVNRLVQTMQSEFLIQGVGPQAGFYVTGAVTMFDTSISAPTDPKSEFVTFQNIRFESSLPGNNAFVMSGKFLRIKFLHCEFYQIRCVNASYYLQSWKFAHCLIKASPYPGNFVYGTGSYDVEFIGCEISNYGATSGTLIKIDNADSSSRGCNGLRIISCEIEGLLGGTCALTGVSGLEISNCHIEANATVDVNLFAGSPGLTNNTSLFCGNYVYCPNGPWIAHGPATNVTSIGNTVTRGGSATALSGQIHNTSVQITNLISIGDFSDGVGGYPTNGGIADQPFTRQEGSFLIRGPISGSSPTMATRMINRRTTLTYSASMTPDGLSNFYDITANNGTAFTINVPTAANVGDGEEIAFRIANNSGGALGAVTFAAGYKLAGAWVSPATGNNRTIRFEFNGSNWYECSRTAADTPN